MSTHAFEMITVDEFARKMEVSRSTVFDWIAKGHLVEGKIYVRIGKTIRFIWSLESVEALSGEVALFPEPVEGHDPLSGGKSSAVNLEF